MVRSIHVLYQTISYIVTTWKIICLFFLVSSSYIILRAQDQFDSILNAVPLDLLLIIIERRNPKTSRKRTSYKHYPLRFVDLKIAEQGESIPRRPSKTGNLHRSENPDELISVEICKQGTVQNWSYM